MANGNFETQPNNEPKGAPGLRKEDTSVFNALMGKWKTFRGLTPNLYKDITKLDKDYEIYYPPEQGNENRTKYIDVLTKDVNGESVLKTPSELLKIEKSTKDKIISDISGNPVFTNSIDESLSKNQNDIRNDIIEKVVGIVVNKKSGGFRTVRASRRLKKHKRSHKAKRTGKGKKTKKHGKRRASKTRKH